VIKAPGKVGGGSGSGSAGRKGDVVFGLKAANVQPRNPADDIPKPRVPCGAAVVEHTPTHFLFKRLLQVWMGARVVLDDVWHGVA
jgi:hypothetical protein